MTEATAERFRESLQMMFNETKAGPSFHAWLTELEKSPEDITNFEVDAEILRKKPYTPVRQYERSGITVVRFTFADGSKDFRVFNRKWEHVTEEWV